jgi:hypothetical protein
VVGGKTKENSRKVVKKYERKLYGKKRKTKCDSSRFSV